MLIFCSSNQWPLVSFYLFLWQYMTVMMILGRIFCDLGISVYRLVQLENTLLFTLLFKICVTILEPLLWDWGLSGHHWIYLGPFFVLIYKLFNIGQQCKYICKRKEQTLALPSYGVDVEKLWSGSTLRCILHGRRIAPTTAMQHSERIHGANTPADKYRIHMDTHSWRQLKTEGWQYSTRQESGL